MTEPTDAELYGDECPGIRGDTRAPKFGEWMRGVWASASNPHRDGMFVRTERRTGRLNPGTWHELTDGNGEFWSYPAHSTVFLTPQPTQAQAGAVPLTDEQITAAAKKLAECMEYPWEFMPEPGRKNMRKHAQDVIGAAYPLGGKP